MMKRIGCAVLSALLLLCLYPAVRAEEVVPIASREDLLRIGQDPAGSYELVADIDMGGEDWVPLPFSGQFNGNGHTLYNLTVHAPGAETLITFDGNRKEYETVFGGLFSTVENAAIRDLGLVNAVVDIETDHHCFVGTLAGYAKDSTVSGCTVDARNHLTITSVNAGVGGIVGFSIYNEFTDCTVDAELVFTDTNKDVLCESFVGGVFSSGCGDVLDCTVRMKGYAEIYGYAHSGGVIGMIKLPRGSFKTCTLGRSTVEADISFFEITPSRRAYCDPLIGENLGSNCRAVRNKVVAYGRHESRTPVLMAPETCEAPSYVAEVTPGDCTTWGYTTYTCTGCGYSYRDSYTPPVHQYEGAVTTAPTCTEEGVETFRCVLCGQSYTEPVPAAGHAYEQSVTEPTCTEAGERVFTCRNCGDRYTEPIPALGHVPGTWVTVLEPQVNVPGEEELSCTVCGEVLERREIPALPYIFAEEVTLSAVTLELTVGQEARLTGSVAPADATEPTVTFTSSDEAVAKVMPDGNLQAVRPGTATVTATSVDGQASAGCTVTVTYTPWQWVKHYILFGWIWE